MYLKKYSLFNSEARFDVVSVILKSSQKAHVEVIKNAFKKVNF
jgi:hypothetical protein